MYNEKTRRQGFPLCGELLFMRTLYIRDYCPYCHRVLDFLENTSLKLEIKDIKNSSYEKELLEIGAKIQVPFLFDQENNVKLYESLDIIKYLKKFI